MVRKLDSNEIRRDEIEKYRTEASWKISIHLVDGSVALLKCDNDDCKSNRFKTDFEPDRDFQGGTVKCLQCSAINVLP